MNKKKLNKGFTLVELLVVIAILAVLASVSVVGYLGFVEKARLSNDQQLVSQINNLIKAEDTYTYGTSNDALEIQYILKQCGINEVKTQSKGNYIFFDNTNRKAVLAALDDEGINIVYSDSSSNTLSKINTTSTYSSKFNINNTNISSIESSNTNSSIQNGKYLDYIYAPESFIKGYTFITTESRDNFAQNIVNIRNGGGVNNDVRDSRKSILESISYFESKSEEVYELLNKMGEHVAFINANEQLVKFSRTMDKDIDTLIFASGLTKLTKKAVSNINSFSVSIIDLPTSIDSVEEEALDVLVEVCDKVSIISNNNDFKEDIKKKVEKKNEENKDKEDKDKVDYNKVEDSIKNSQDKDNELSSVNVSFKNKDTDGTLNDYVSNLVKTIEFNKKTNSIKIDPKMDIDYLRNKTDYENGNSSNSNLYFNGYYVYDDNNYYYGKVDESTGKFIFNRDDVVNGIPSNLIVIAEWSENDNSSKFKTFGNNLKNSSVYTNMILTFSDSIVLSLVNTNQYGELFKNLKGNGYYDDIVGTFDTYTIYPIVSNYVLNNDLIIPSNVTLWTPYNSNFDDLNITGTSFIYYPKNDEQTLGCSFTNSKINANCLKTFTINKGVAIYNYGDIRVGATIYSSGNPDSGLISGNYGEIINNGSLINNGGNIYAIGKINSKEGEFKCLSGRVYEEMVLEDWHGGTNAAGCKNGNVAPFNAWNLKSVDGKIIFENDGEYYASLLVYTPKTSTFNIGYLPIVGQKALFYFDNDYSYVEKEYDEKLNISLYGDLKDEKVTMNIATVVDVDLSEIPFPLSNMHITLNSGSTVTLSNNKYKVLPDSYIDVKNESTLNINTDFALYEKFNRGDVDAYWKTSYDKNNTMKGAYINNEGEVNISKNQFSGDIKQNGGILKINSDVTLKTSFSEGRGVEPDDASSSYKCKKETNLVTGSYNGMDYDNCTNYTKIIIDRKEYLVKTIDEIKALNNSSINVI